MAARYELEARITSATDLKNVNWRHGQLKPYAVVWVEPQTKCATYADVAGGALHRWDQKLFIPFSTPILESILHIDMRHAEGTRPLIGSAQIALCNVGLGYLAERTLQLKRPSGRTQGKIEVEFTVRELGSGVDEVAGISIESSSRNYFPADSDDDDDYGNDDYCNGPYKCHLCD